MKTKRLRFRTCLLLLGAALLLHNCQKDEILSLEDEVSQSAAKGTKKNPKTVSIPDINFERALIAIGIDDVEDGLVEQSNLQNITSLDVSSSSITDLTGLDDFKSLESLNCSGNQLMVLDVSRIKGLRGLICNNNQLNSLDVSKNQDLTNLDVTNNNLLGCVQVNLDQHNSIPVGWVTDAGVSFQLDCNIKNSAFLINKTWDFFFDHNPDLNLFWNGDVTFYADGTARYDEPAAPGRYLEFGTWSLVGDVLTYSLYETPTNAYVFTATIGKNSFEGTYTFGTEEPKRFTATRYADDHFENLLKDTTWDIFYNHLPEIGSVWNADVIFHADGTTEYDEPAEPGRFYLVGSWSVVGNELTYIMDSSGDTPEGYYVLTGVILGNTMSGTYTFGDRNPEWSAIKYE